MLTFIPTPLGNLKDISLRALEAFREADVLLCEDTRVTKRLLYLLKEDGLLSCDLSTKIFLSFHTHNQDEFLSKLDLDSNFFNSKVVYSVDAGMPCISDPGAQLIKYAKMHNIAYEVLPGGSAFSLAYALSGLESSFNFKGFLPSTQKARLEALKTLSGINVLYESPKRILELLKDINSSFTNCEVYAYKELTKLHFKSFSGSPSEVLESMKGANLNGEWCVVLDVKQDSKFITMDEKELLSLRLPLKDKAKLLAKLRGTNPKECYAFLEAQKEKD
ncbi:16S rRNA (cytidine(1402)-2'-O)-methyltransferase [Helicobacter sp. 13S00401-1]|uniref:16S rRNA (cytidine(1402)-2'-O)-methyltransferase n=1 Tax=Helicobacter sp. 13S00401-1 TaxID=1905758 RepID=UPI000BA6DD4C|nr:16S rRNA (cytidine(1402)-2'-O)-methyltransferase [Helicobacter sp. 13S00401-1]PAF50780.1 16S rRNA (cytidine(1402)-2'-O)-methyltransferase [Helicobacter sp. 13S00401-1]